MLIGLSPMPSSSYYDRTPNHLTVCDSRQERGIVPVMPERKESAKRSKKLSANASDEEIADFQDACRRAEIEPSDTLRKLAHALKVYVDEHGHVVFPIRIAPPQMKK